MIIALLGFGIEGRSAYYYFKDKYPDALFKVYDNEDKPKYALPEDVEFVGGLDSFHSIKADLIIRTPAIHPSKISSYGCISSTTQEFFNECKAPIVGITGTKGKGTTASLVELMLKKAGIKTWLLGNIGKPCLDSLRDINKSVEDGYQCVIIYEMSSFQLWDMKKSPHVAVVLMIEPEHLNVHDDFDDYVNAKSNIVKYQKTDDATIYYSENEISVSLANKSNGRKIPYKIETGEWIKIDGENIIKREDIVMHGDHNVANVQAAALSAWQFTKDKNAIKDAVKEFKGLPYRLEEIGDKGGVTFINDSFSSAPPATLAAVNAFKRPKILIMGGFDRGLDFTEVLNSVIKVDDLKRILLIGQTKNVIANTLKTLGWKQYEIVDDLEQAVIRANEIAQKGDYVILSPGCASFDMFDNFTHRGDEFNRIVGNL